MRLGVCAFLVVNGKVLIGASDTGDQSANLGRGFSLERSKDEFGVRSHGIVEGTGSSWKIYPLPQSDVDTWKRLRREDEENFGVPPTAATYQRQEVIGPYQVEGGRVWFGNEYYDGEGDTGVGAFRYFDMDTRQYGLFSPPEIARWEISALLVEPGAVWLGLDHFAEDVSKVPGGLVRWDRHTQQIQRYPLEFLIEHIRRDTNDPSELVLSTVAGYALFRNGDLERFRVEKGAGGKGTAVRITRFPPLPSHY